MRCAALAAFGIPLVVTAACAPLSSFRPASGIGRGRDVEVGAGATLVGTRPYVDEPVRAGGQAWASTEVGSNVGLTLIGSFDDDALGVGVAARVLLERNGGLAWGVEGELGYGWAALSVPLALRMWGESWAYAAPRFGTWGIGPVLALPVGASFHAGEAVFLRVEGQAAVQDLAWTKRRFLAGAAIAHQR